MSMVAFTLWWYHWSSAEFFDELGEGISCRSVWLLGKVEDLLKCFVVHKTSGIFWDLQLPFLDMFTKLPTEAC